VRQYFAQGFVNLCRARLASQTVAKLTLDHMEGRFDIAALVVALHETFLIKRIVVKDSLPDL
jgi:hypothetical protein